MHRYLHLDPGEMAAINNCTAIMTDPHGRYRLTPHDTLAAFRNLTLYTNAESCPMVCPPSPILYRANPDGNENSVPLPLDKQDSGNMSTELRFAPWSRKAGTRYGFLRWRSLRRHLIYRLELG